jgi:hypothetical protein
VIRSVFSLRAALVAQLPLGETLLWAGQPDPRKMVRSLKECLWGVALLTIASICSYNWFLSVWINIRPLGWADALPALVLGVFLILGVLLLVAPVIGILMARKSLIALTNYRVIDFHAGDDETSFISYPIAEFGKVRVVRKRDGTGHLIVDAGVFRSAESGRNVIDRVEFTGLPDIAGLDRALAEARQALQAKHT